ncbi:MAG: DUF2029 domain-containing protein, partial [Planctomycetaceae bacterium]
MMKPTLWLTADSHSGSQPTGQQTNNQPGFRPLVEIRRHWAVFLGLAAALVVWCAVDVAPRARIIPGQLHLHMTDFTVYTEAARAILNGQSPYEATNVRGWPYVYPPLFALLVSPLAPLPEPWQAAAFFALCIGFAFGSYCEIRWLLDLTRRPHDDNRPTERLFAVLAFTVALFPALNCLQRGQVGLFLLYPLLAGLRWALAEQSRAKWFAAGGLLALSPVIKLTPALPVCTLLLMLLIQALLRRDRRARFAWVTAGTTGGAVFYLLLLPSLFVGWNRNLTHLETFYRVVVTKVDDVRTSDFGGNVASKRNQSLSNAAFRLGNWVAARTGAGPDDLLADKPGTPMPMDHPHARQIILAVRLLALAGLLAVAVIAASRQDTLALIAAYGLAMMATLVVSPVARGHYFLLWLPGALFVPLWLDRAGSKAARRLAFVPAVLCVVHYLLLDFAGRVGLLGLGTTVWFFAAVFCLFPTCRAAPALLTDGDPMLPLAVADESLS